MTYEEVKNLLRQISENKKLLRIIQKRIEETREQAKFIPSLCYEKERVKGGDITPVQQRFIERIERLEEQFSAAFEMVCQGEDMIADNMRNLTPTEQTIVIERYMHGKSWRRIEKEYNYTHDGCMSIHRRALKKISK